MVDDLSVGLVEARGEVGLRDRHADGVADALAERAWVVGSVWGELGAVVASRGKEARRQTHRQTGGSAPLLTGRDLHALGDKVLRVARRLAVPLAERLEVVELFGGRGREGEGERAAQKPSSAIEGDSGQKRTETLS